MNPREFASVLFAVVGRRRAPPAPAREDGRGRRAGSTLGDLVRAYGPARFDAAECALYATFERAEGLSFRLMLPGPSECTELSRLAESQRGVPSDARVQEVVIRGRDRAS
jgi:hypothetical protein